MIIKITSKRQVTFPARVLDALGVRPGDQLELEEALFCGRGESIPTGLRRCAASFNVDAVGSISNRSASNPMTRRFGIDTSVTVKKAFPLTSRPARSLSFYVSYHPA